MSRIRQLAEKYGRYIAVPWQQDVAPAKRVIFCIYNAVDELKLRAEIGEFEIATHQADQKRWQVFDLTDTFAEWLSKQRYVQSFYQQPSLISTVLDRFRTDLVRRFEEFLSESKEDANTATALLGVGSLFGLIKVSGLVEALAPLVKGRLIVFFPGTIRDHSNYRLFDAYDGWNYLAVPITADEEQ